MKLNRLLALVLSGSLALSVTVGNAPFAFAASADSNETSTSQTNGVEVEQLDGSDYDLDLTRDDAVTQDNLDDAISPDEDVRVIIVMDGDSVVSANSAAVYSNDTAAQMEEIKAAQDKVIADIEETALDGDDLTVSYQYSWLVNGVAATVPYGKLSDIESVDGVDQVVMQTVYEPCSTDETTSSNIVYPRTISDGQMIGREDTWAQGYKGEGMKIAIIDTGLDTDHQNFAALPDEVLTDTSLTQADIDGVLTSLNAYERYSGLTSADLYYNTKVTYGFNYVDNSLDITHDNDTEGDHGTHVAGIAAANKVDESEVVGVAPNAQLMVMKVFGANGGAYTEDWVAGMEDAMMLGADVINMSLGSDSGFTTDVDWVDEVFDRVAETGTVLCISAGNSDTMGQGNAWGTNANLTSNPDSGVLGTPGAYANAMSVASVENAYYMSDYITVGDNYKIAYQNGGSGVNAPLNTLADTPYEVVVVPGTGTVEDFASVDVSGKIALVQRGVIAFTEKCQNAQDAGAVACLVYNNESGTIIMDMTDSPVTIPCASITMADGAYILSALEENPDLTLTVGADQALIASDTAYQMSDFSSWGVTPSLTLEPDITTPGGNIYSTMDDGTYGLMSGTSMAAPNLSGISALVKEYVMSQDGLGKADGADTNSLVRALLMSTSKPLVYQNQEGLYYSPRSQGSGLADAYGAVTTQAYLTVDGCDVPKVELYDDPDQTGSYNYSFNVTNFGDATLFYDLNTVAQTEGVNSDYADQGYLFMSHSPMALAASTGESTSAMAPKFDVTDSGVCDSHDAYWIYRSAVAGAAMDENWTDVEFRYNTNGDDVVNDADVQSYLNALVGLDSDTDLAAQVMAVAPGATETVNVNVTLADSDRTYFADNYPNGGYVEGFTFLTALNANGTDLSLPYLGFYGDWTDAPIFDGDNDNPDTHGFYWGDDSIMDYSQYISALWTNIGGQTSGWVPGLNPYVEETFDLSHVSLSPNGDGNGDYVDDMYISLLRNAATLTFTYTDTNTGEEYFSQTVDHVQKSNYVAGYDMCVPYVYSWYGTPYKLTDAEGNTLPNNTNVTLTISATLDYPNSPVEEKSVSFTVDTTAPELLGTELTQEDGKSLLTLTFSDNLSVAGINFCNSNVTNIYAQYAADDAQATVDENGNRVWKQTYDVTGMGDHFTLVLGDYALNESYYSIKVPGNDIALDDTLLYGYRVADNEISDDSLYGWIGMDLSGETVTATACSSEYYMDYALTAAEQVGGYILAVDANNKLVVIQPGYWDERTEITDLSVGIRDLAYDASTQTLYGLTSDTRPQLVTIDMISGQLEYVNADNNLASATAITCDDQGTLYGIYGPSYGSQPAELRTIDTASGVWGETLMGGEGSDMPGSYYGQSMTWKDGTIYWAQYNMPNFGSYGQLYALSQDESGTWTMDNCGAMAGNAEVVGLLFLDTNQLEWPDTDLQALKVSPNEVALLEGNSATLAVTPDPWYCDTQLTWSTSDANVAVVNEGTVTATGVGTATITVTDTLTGVTGTATINVVAPDSQINGFVIASVGDDGLASQWTTFNASNPADYQTLNETQALDYMCAEYVGGTLYAYDEQGNFYTVDPTDYSYQKVASKTTSYSMKDLSYDYSTGYLYGLAQDANSGATDLVTVDTMDGQVTKVGTLVDSYNEPACAFAVDNDGLVYFVTQGYGFLCTYDVDTQTTENLGLTGCYPAAYNQSMAFDHDTGELYWSAMTATQFDLMYIDLNTAAALDLGAVDAGSQIVGLHIVPENAPQTPEVPVTSVTTTSDSINILEGASNAMPVKVEPSNATNRNVQWTVADETVATIENGMVTGLKQGTTTATGTLGEFTVEVTINVLVSSGEMRGFVLQDLTTMAMGFWLSEMDYDLHNPGAADALYASDYDVYAATYYNGKMYAYGENPQAEDYQTDGMHFFVIDAQTGKMEMDVTGYDYFTNLCDMTFDYTDGALYVVGNAKNSTGNSTLYTMDTTTGQLYAVAALDRYVVGLAADENGTLYAVDFDGNLCTMDKRTGEITVIGDTGVDPCGYQSLAFDFDTDCLYWAYSNVYSDPWAGIQNRDTAVYVVDTTDASVVKVGDTGCMLSGLYFPTDNEPQVPDTVKADSLVVNPTSLLLNKGETAQLSALVLPVSVSQLEGVSEVTFTSDNEAVATVDREGNITAVGLGVAQITVSAGDLSVTCSVSVVDDTVQMYAFNQSGWETTKLLDPSETLEEAVSDTLGFTIAQAVYNSDDGYVYALDENNTLYKLALDLSWSETLGTVDTQDADILDLAYNSYNDTLYVLTTSVNAETMETTYTVQELSTEDATLGQAYPVSRDIDTPVSIAFNSADTFYVYEAFMDYIYLSTLDGTTVTSVLWAQQSMSADADTFSMVYSQTYQRLFIMTVDTYYGTGEQTLYMVDPLSGTITHLGDGAWTKDVVDLLLVEGAAPSPAPTAEVK